MWRLLFVRLRCSPLFFTDDYKKEKATRTLIGGSLMALVGVAMVVYNGSFVLKISPLGDCLTLVAALSWAFYSLIMKKMTGRYNTILLLARSFSMAYWLRFPSLCFNLGRLTFLCSFSLPFCWIYCFWVWLLPWFVCSLECRTENLGTVRASNYIYLNPLFTLVGSAILLDEHLTVIALIGAACIMGGVYMAGKK